MMADSVEAASRSLSEYTEESISNLVEKIIDCQMEEGFFKDCPITFHDITTAKEVFKEKLKTIYHTRISYPELKKKGEEGGKGSHGIHVEIDLGGRTAFAGRKDVLTDTEQLFPHLGQRYAGLQLDYNPTDVEGLYARHGRRGGPQHTGSQHGAELRRHPRRNLVKVMRIAVFYIDVH